MLAFVVFAGHTVLATWTLCRSWLPRLLGGDTSARLVAKDSRWDADPGTVGEWLRVRRHAASGQAERVRTHSRVAALIRDIVLPFPLLVTAGITAAIGYGLYRWALGLLP
jgi:hypothetical protein